MEKTVIDRIKFIMEMEKENPNSFAKAIKVNSATIYNILNGDSKPSIDTFEKILKNFSAYNRNWLMTGEGDFRALNTTNVIKGDLSAEVLELLKNELSFKDKVINRLESELDKVWQIALSKGNPNFLKASDVAEIPYYFLSGVYSGANAQC